MRPLILILVVTLLNAGCEADQSRWIPDRPNGQPGWIPCMAGDRFCTR